MAEKGGRRENGGKSAMVVGGIDAPARGPTLPTPVVYVVQCA